MGLVVERRHKYQRKGRDEAKDHRGQVVVQAVCDQVRDEMEAEVPQRLSASQNKGHDQGCKDAAHGKYCTEYRWHGGPLARGLFACLCSLPICLVDLGW